MKNIIFGLHRTAFFSLLIACGSASSASFTDADVAEKGSYTLQHLLKEDKAKISMTVKAAVRKDTNKPIGNYNYLSVLDVQLNGKKIVIPTSCKSKQSLIDIHYIRLDDDGKNIRFWIQGGDASEAYQVAFYLLSNKTVKCKFFPEKNQISIEPMMSKKTLELLKNKTK